MFVSLSQFYFYFRSPWYKYKAPYHKHISLYYQKHPIACEQSMNGRTNKCAIFVRYVYDMDFLHS